MKRTYLIVRLTVMTGLLVAALVTPDRERDAVYSATVTSEDGMCYVQHAHERHELTRDLAS